MPSYEVLEDVEINDVELKSGMRVELSQDEAGAYLEKGLIAFAPVETEPVPTYAPSPAPTPTVGRIVHYKSGEMLAAIVTSVQENGSLNLLVAYPSGWTPKTGILEGVEDGTWSWPVKQ